MGRQVVSVGLERPRNLRVSLIYTVYLVYRLGYIAAFCNMLNLAHNTPV